MKISDMGANDRSMYLGLDNPNASEDILFARNVANRLEINPTQRVLLIGLGGCGIRVVNRVKAEVKRRFQDYQGKIAFLAIDTDADDMRLNAADLDLQKEQYVIPHCDAMRYIVRANRTPFTKSWIHERFDLDFNIDPNGAGQNRQAMRCMLYDATDTMNPVDKQIVNRITESLQPLKDGFTLEARPGIPAMRLEVMIVLGVAGGTGSGGLIDIAQFARAAVKQHRATFGASFGVTGYFFMKDVVEWITREQPQDFSKAHNCYAALKELDYYMSVSQREEFRKDILQFSPNGPDPISLDTFHPLYTTAYLVNGTGGEKAFKEALDSVAEGIINLVADAKSENANAILNNPGATQTQRDETQLVTSFRSNQHTARNALFNGGIYDTNKDENLNTFAEDVFNYSAIGVATTYIPESDLRSYAIHLMAQTVAGNAVAGFTPANAFQGWSTNLLTVPKAQQEINNLLTASPANLVAEITAQVNSINWPNNFLRLSRDDIIAGNVSRAGNALQCQYNGALQTACAQQGTMLTWVEEEMKRKYTDFEKSAKSFLQTYGPRAFTNLYNGFAQNNQTFDGLKKTIDNWRQAGELGQMSAAGAQNKEVAARNAVAVPVLGTTARRINDYHNAFLKWQREITACKMRDHLVGGIYETEYLNKIEQFAERVKEFARVLDTLLNAYSGFSDKISTYQRFQQRCENLDAINVNLLRTEDDYNWAIGQVKDLIQNVSFEEVRNDLIDSFTAHPTEWTEYPVEHGSSPRRLFDSVMRKHFQAQIGGNDVRIEDKLSIDAFLKWKQVNHATELQNDVNSIVSNLVLKAKVRFNKDPGFYAGGGNSKQYLMIPKGLTGGDEHGQAIMAAIHTAAQGNNVEIFPSTVGDKLVCFQIETALALYAMQNLSQWESAYDAAGADTTLHINMSTVDMWGKPSIYDPVTGLAWRDYPEITKPATSRDPRQQDHTGRVSREGRFMRDVFDPLFEDALKQHIIEREKTPNGYTYWYYDLTNQAWNYGINLRFCPQDEEGYYVKGQALFTRIAEQNHGTLGDMHHKVEINNPGFNEETTDERKALDRAKRALRKNVPMFIAVKRSVIKAKELFAEIDAANKTLQEGKIQEIVPYYIGLGLLQRGPLEKWTIGTKYPGIASGREIASLTPNTADNAKNPLFGEKLTYYVLVERFTESMKADQNLFICEEQWKIKENDAQTAFKTTELQEALDRLNAFKDEADNLVAKYVGNANLLELNGLRERLSKIKVNAEKKVDVDRVIDCYTSYLNVYKNLENLIRMIEAEKAKQVENPNGNN